MANNWKETQQLFSKLISDPPLEQKFLQKPAPTYIFKIVLNIMKKTGFPNGLYTEQEKNLEYFKANIENKEQFMKKVVEVTRLVTKNNFPLDIFKMLKGEETEKTNVFLQNFYKAATSDNKSDKDRIIQNYLNKNNSNISQSVIQNSDTIIRKIKFSKDEQVKGYLFWIDKNINNQENKGYAKKLKDNPKNLKELTFLYFDNVEQPFELILNYIKFKIMFVLISGSLYSDYYHQLKNGIKFIKCFPICVIFTSEQLKEIYIKKEENNFIDKEILSSINHPFFNLGGVSSNFDHCISFFTNFYTYYESLQDKYIGNKREADTYEGCLTFECIINRNQLIFPFLYYKSIENINVSENEINYFKNYLLSNHGEKQIAELLIPMMYIREIPHELIAKIFARIYTQQTSFYPEMNKYLMKKKGKDYQTFITVLLEGLANGSLHNSDEKVLYRGTKMTRKEVDEIIKRFEKWKNTNDKSLPSFLLYSRAFLSFTKNEDKLLNFLGKTDNNFYAVVFKLNYNGTLDNKYSSNVDIESISVYQKEREVLFLPYTTFCLQNITKEDYKDRKDCIIINLDYLGEYEYILNQFKEDETFQKNYIDTFNINKPTYSKEIIKNNLIELKPIENKAQEKSKNINLEELKLFKKIKLKIKNKIEEQKKDPIKIPDDSLNDVVVIEANEEIKIEEKKEESKDIKIEENLINNIKEEKEKKEEKNKKYFLLDNIQIRTS